MNPIYKFELTANGTTQRAFPIYKDDLTKDFEKESGQEFFRAKLSGNLTFESNDYAFIVSKAFDTQFVLEIFISYNAGQTWTSYWRGTFWKTDCEFDGDEQTVKVKPTVWDQYNDVLAGMDKEYNLIELAPEITPVKADKRPMIQVYVPGQTVIACFLSGMWWEQECEAVNESDTVEIEGQTYPALEYKYHFSFNKAERVINISQTGSPSLPNVFAGTRPDLVTTGYEFTNGNYKFKYTWTVPGQYVQMDWEIIRVSDSVTLWSYRYTGQNPPVNYPMEITMTPVAGSGATGNVIAYIYDIPVYSRYVTDVETARGLNTYPLPTDDLVENNRNYSRAIGYYFPETIWFMNGAFMSTPTQWGLYQPGKYYYSPADNPILGIPEAFPIARNVWGLVSIWFVFSSMDWYVEQEWRKAFTIRHAYPLASVLSVLLAKIAPGITHAGTTVYSQFLYGTNLIGLFQTILITPKSNLVTAGYDQPAQNAPITLKNVLDMLRDCFRCYWFIDSNNRFRVEHIEYFRRGGSYSSNPVVGIDLTAEKVTRNSKAWDFARNQYKFDKPDMAARYQFGWMDDVTQLFDGYPIDIISKYVNPDNIEQIDISKFTSDIDFILLNPGEISKDGFALLSATEKNEVNGTEEYVLNPRYVFWRNCPESWHGRTITLRARTSSGTARAYNYIGSTGGVGSGEITTSWSTVTLLVQSNTTRFGFLGDTDNATVYLSAVYAGELGLPYGNFVVNGADHILQNPYLAFVYLQRYYAFDMPAQLYEINGTQMYAYGIKKLKKQTLRFPILTDPDLLKLIKTNIGNGMIEKLSVNLSSRNGNATLEYDTE